MHWGFLAAEVRALPQTTDAAQAVNNPVIDGMDLLFSGQQWTADRAAARAAGDAAATFFAAAADAAEAAAFSAFSANAARAAARAATAAANSVNAATYAAYAAKAAEAAGRARLRQRDTLLALIAAA